MIKAILFDLDETLLDRTATVDAYIRNQHTRYQVAATYEIYRARFHELDEHGYADKNVLFGTLATEFGLPLPVDELIADFYANAWNRCQLFPGTKQQLQTLRSGFKLGIITNGSSRSQRAKLNGTGLSELVDTILVSEEAGIKKPTPEIFLRAAEQLGVTTSECMFVGDNPRADIAGAHDVGMTTVWFQRHFPWPNDLDIQPHQTITTLTALRID